MSDNVKTVKVDFRIFKRTKEKLEQEKHKMSKMLNYKKDMTWDEFYDILTNMYSSQTDNLLERKFDFLIEESSKVDTLRDEIVEYFKQQNNQIEKLLEIIVKQNNSMEIIQEIKSIKIQNDAEFIDIKGIQNFNLSLNEELKNVVNYVKGMLSTVGDISPVLRKIEAIIRHHFGVSSAILIHHIAHNTFITHSILSENISADKWNNILKQSYEEINKNVMTYKKIYDEISQNSGEYVDKVIRKYSLEELLKK